MIGLFVSSDLIGAGLIVFFYIGWITADIHSQKHCNGFKNHYNVSEKSFR